MKVEHILSIDHSRHQRLIFFCIQLSMYGKLTISKEKSSRLSQTEKCSIEFSDSSIKSGSKLQAVFFGVDSCTRNTLEIRSLPSILHFWKVKIRSGMIPPRRSTVKGSQGDPLQGVKISKWEFFYSESRFGFSSKKQLKNLLFFFSFFSF